MNTCFDKAILGAAGAASTVGIDKLAELIKNTITKARKPASGIPPVLLTIESKMRPGMSSIELTANLLNRRNENHIKIKLILVKTILR